MVYFNQNRLVSLERVTETMADLYGQNVSEGIVVSAGRCVAQQVNPVNELVKQLLAEQSEVVSHHDETGVRLEEHKVKQSFLDVASYTLCLCVEKEKL